MDWNDLLAFALILAVGQFSPGPDLILITRTALARGRSAGLFCVAGITTGLVAHAVLAVTSVTVLMGSLPSVWRVIQMAGAVYLLYLALVIWKNRDEGGEVARLGDDAVTSDSLWADYRRGLMTNLLNPKAMVFFATLVASFSADAGGGWWLFALAVVIVIEGLVLWGLWVLALQIGGVRQGYVAVRRWINGAFAVLLVAAAIKLSSDAIF